VADQLRADRDALLVALRNLVTSVRTNHNQPEALGWAEEAIVNSVQLSALEKAALGVALPRPAQPPGGSDA
jgi:hypothetical protein